MRYTGLSCSKYHIYSSILCTFLTISTVLTVTDVKNKWGFKIILILLIFLEGHLGIKKEMTFYKINITWIITFIACIVPVLFEVFPSSHCLYLDPSNSLYGLVGFSIELAFKCDFVPTVSYFCSSLIFFSYLIFFFFL